MRTSILFWHPPLVERWKWFCAQEILPQSRLATPVGHWICLRICNVVHETACSSEYPDSSPDFYLFDHSSSNTFWQSLLPTHYALSAGNITVMKLTLSLTLWSYNSVFFSHMLLGFPGKEILTNRAHVCSGKDSCMIVCAISLRFLISFNWDSFFLVESSFMEI